MQNVAQRCEHVRLLQKIGDELLTSHEFRKVADRLQNPGAQSSPTHRGNSPVDGREQARIARAAGGDQFQVDLGCSIEHHVIGRRVATQGPEVIDFSAQLMFEVMNDRACGGDRLWQVGAAETVE